MNQLGQILDRINVVMRRRRNQTDTGLRITQSRDRSVDFMARQLTALAGLGTLRDLDLQHLGIDQICRRDAETARGDLLDLRHFFSAVARRILATLAGIAAATQSVHADRERLVRFWRQCAKRHSSRIEAFEDRLDRLDLVQRNRRSAGFQSK